MSRDNDFVSVLKARQSLIRRELMRRNITLKGVSFDSGIPYPTLVSYFPEEGGREPALMPVSALYALCGAVPEDILSVLLPDGRLIVRVPEAMDHDEIAAAMREFLAAKDQAHHPDSPEGRDLADCEDAVLRRKFAVVTGGKAAA